MSQPPPEHRPEAWQVPPNSYGLRVVADVATYRQQVATNPHNELVNLARAVPKLHFDLRYATPHNVVGVPLYAQAVAYLRRPAAEALAKVQQALTQHGAALLVYDAYRPYHVTLRMWQHIQNETYAAPPWRGSRHNRGCSVDVGLVERATGRPLPMPTDFDDLTPTAHTSFEPVSAAARHNRALLLEAMTRCGFVNYPGEWWHYDFARWADFDLLDVPLELL